MQYSFDVQEAIDYGVDEAIIIWNLRFWIIKNKANNKHQYAGDDGVIRTWTYNSIKAFEDLFPFWTTRQIRTVLDNLLKKDLIIKGNFNATSYDRTVWYAFKQEDKFISQPKILAHLSDLTNGDVKNDKSISQKRQIDLSEMKNGNAISDKPIPDIKPNIKNDIKTEELNNFSFFVNGKTANEEDLEKYKKEKNYKSSVKEYIVFNNARGWKGVEDRYAHFDGWELNYLKLNPCASQETTKEINEQSEEDKKLEEEKAIKRNFYNGINSWFGINEKQIFDSIFKRNWDTVKLLEKGFSIQCSKDDEKLLKTDYYRILSHFNITLEC